MDAYKQWVRRNKDYVRSLHSLANGLTWLLPERFSESEIGPEAVSTILGITTAINEHIIETTPTRLHPGSVEPHSFPYPLCISALKDLETLVEVAAEHYYGDDKKWNFLAVTEAIKVLVRLALFRNSGYKMLLHGGETPNIENSIDASTSQHRSGGNANLGGYHRPSTNSHSEGKALSALSRFGENARMVSDPVWLHRVQHQLAVMEPPTPIIKRPTIATILSEKGFSGALFLMGEVLFITRPLIYVLFIRKYGIRSWIPWSISLGVDVIGMSILSQLTMSGCGKNNRQLNLSALEKDEVRRRKMLWAFYVMRDPFFSNYTRGRLESAEKLLGPVPIVGFLAEKVVELVIGAQTRYTYMSGS